MPDKWLEPAPGGMSRRRYGSCTWSFLQARLAADNGVAAQVNGGPMASFEYFVLRCVPRVDRQEFLNVGVVLYSQESRFLRAACRVVPERLTALGPDIDIDDINAHLETIAAICRGDESGGPGGRCWASASGSTGWPRRGQHRRPAGAGRTPDSPGIPPPSWTTCWTGSSASRQTPAMPDDRFLSDRFPRSSRYHPDWVLGSAGGGANSLWLTEWLSEAMDLSPGCGCWTSGAGGRPRRYSCTVSSACRSGRPTCGSARPRTSSASPTPGPTGVFPLHADARSLPFAGEFFDAIVCIDSFPYFGTDDLYLNYLAHFVKPGGQIGIAGAGLVKELDGRGPRAPAGVLDAGLLVPALGRLVGGTTGARPGSWSIETADTMPEGLGGVARLAPDRLSREPAGDPDSRGGRRALPGLRAGASGGATGRRSWRSTAGRTPCGVTAEDYSPSPLLREED